MTWTIPAWCGGWAAASSPGGRTESYRSDRAARRHAQMRCGRGAGLRVSAGACRVRLRAPGASPRITGQPRHGSQRSDQAPSGQLWRRRSHRWPSVPVPVPVMTVEKVSWGSGSTVTPLVPLRPWTATRSSCRRCPSGASTLPDGYRSRIPAAAVAATTAALVLRRLMTDSFGDATTADSPGHAKTDHANTPTGPELSCPALTFRARFADVSLTSCVRPRRAGAAPAATPSAASGQRCRASGVDGVLERLVMYKASEFVEHKLSETMTFGPEGTAEVGCQDHVGKGEEWRVMGGRLRVRDIEYSGEVGSGAQDRSRGGLVDECATRGVDQRRTRPQGVQQPGPDRAAGLGQEGAWRLTT